MPFNRRPTAHLSEKLYGKCAPDFTHLAKSLCVGVVDMHYFDLDLGPMTLVLKLDRDMVRTYSSTTVLKRKFLSHLLQKLELEQTHTHTHTHTHIHTHTHRHDKNIASPHTRAIINALHFKLR